MSETTDEKTLERLNELLDQKDEELNELRREKEKREADAVWETERKWMLHRHVPKEDDAPNLPVPRLQLRYVPSKDFGWYSYEVVYELVYRHFLGRARIGSSGDPDLLAIPLGHTRVNGSGLSPRQATPPVLPYALPFRDGKHIVSDAEHLRLPMFALIEDKATPIEPHDLHIEPGR